MNNPATIRTIITEDEEVLLRFGCALAEHYRSLPAGASDAELDRWKDRFETLKTALVNTACMLHGPRVGGKE